MYFVAGVGVVYTPRGIGAGAGPQGSPASASVVGPGGHSQHFFLGHTDDIKAMAVCNAEVDVNGRKYPARTVVATAQVGVGAKRLAARQRVRHGGCFGSMVAPQRCSRYFAVVCGLFIA